jgi:hypothetical protein
MAIMNLIILDLSLYKEVFINSINKLIVNDLII